MKSQAMVELVTAKMTRKMADILRDLRHTAHFSSVLEASSARRERSQDTGKEHPNDQIGDQANGEEWTIPDNLPCPQ